MPSSYSGFNRPRKSTKSSAASVISTSSKTSKPSVDKLKKDVPPPPPPPPAAQSTEPSGGSGYTPKAQPPPVALPATKAKEGKENALNVFEYLESDSETDSDSDSDVTSSDDDDLRPPFPPSSSSKPKAPAARQPNTAVPVQNRPRPSPAKPKETQPPGSFDTSPVAAPLQLARHAPAHRRPSTDASISVAGSHEGSLPPEHRNLELVPEDYYPRTNSTSVRRGSFPPSPPQSPEEDLHRSGRKIRRNTKSSRLPTGYGLIAWRLSTSAEGKEYSIPPLYRRFEDVNHRVLLYLQDEIAQLEEELRVLDDYEEMQRRGVAEQEGTKVMPASRRMDVQAQAYSSLHYRREEVMGILIQKTEQYNNALAAYGKVLQTLPRASETDVDTYRKWMKGNTPIAPNEMRFLEHRKDLVSLFPQKKSESSSITPPVYSAIIIASAAIILPLLAFSMIAEFAGRILVVAVVGGASAAVAANYSTGTEHLVKSQDGWRCAGLYFGFMTVAALCI
ncbi:hypothetical protein BJX64DRAFT_240212 [Aspergillus heterothallicus]